VLDLDPNNGEALIAKGATLAKQNLNNEAIVDFEKALKIDPENQNAKKYYEMVKNKLVSTNGNHHEEIKSKKIKHKPSTKKEKQKLIDHDKHPTLTLEYKKNSTNPPIGHLINLGSVPTTNRKRKKSKQDQNPVKKRNIIYKT